MMKEMNADMMTTSMNEIPDPKTLLLLYEWMLRVRIFDERAMMLQRQGRIGFYVPSTGQEAIQIGTASLSQPEDIIFPSYREPGVLLYRGVSLKTMLCNLFGNSGDICLGRQMPVHYSARAQGIFSISSPIATQIIQAVGAAYALKYKKKQNTVVFTYFGDGATSANDFHSGLTFAGVMKVPIIFILTNNQYAISVPATKQTACRDLYAKGEGYGVPSLQVDGNDIVSIYTGLQKALHNVRLYGEPLFIECVSYRQGPHSSSDDPTRYRNPDETNAWKKKDPLLKHETFLKHMGLWDDAWKNKLLQSIKEEIQGAIEEVESLPPPALSTMMQDVYKDLHFDLEEELRDLLYEEKLQQQFNNTSEAFPL